MSANNDKPMLNQVRARATPGTYADTWKPVFAWHLGDVLEHIRLDCNREAESDLVAAHLYQMSEDDKIQLDEFIDDMADAHNHRIADLFCEFSDDLFAKLHQRAAQWRADNT